RGAELEPPRPRPHPAVEEARERVLVRRPDVVLPAEPADDVRKGRVHLLVGDVPLLALRLLDPARDLAPLLADPGEPVAEHQRDPVLDGVGLAAREAAERTLLDLLGDAGLGLD